MTPKNGRKNGAENFLPPISNQSNGQIIAINKTFPGKDFAFEIFSDRCVGKKT